MPSSQDLVILFTRYPSPGKCKTRLIPVLGDQGAVRIHQQLVRHILKELDACISRDNTELCIYYDGCSRQDMEAWLGNGYSFVQQEGEELGQRMAQALIQTLGQGQNVILLGSDCPDISASLLQDALDSLHHHDMVIGPAHDGGYYLIGLARNVSIDACRNLFSEIPWSTPQVLSKTLERAQKQKLHIHTLPTLHDIDRADDLKYFHHHSHPQ
ncbi:MAG: TIGR04282 family arsenosugar biosynthesis glycosyltransferase [Proteobacteria bacterium]|nr:TIGR04282 family arsenosugar biosynthesis glycosyltransferase [Pseudomonadota bacterium]MBU1140587.1 TIGR04282 family arsenosugar biosynthesis glycosyltransferase [Pseudomonadota bacterium]MBU1232824.1 TIGR04282 family arsenosugar biosynthesis glycosyltransferase [Pseudomonadota bacterium]MBU1418406.1 TIGR04282 family arsenosugar biosynthesis glycosyltransferase [Pseudomonadota bacterium]MBU1455336.1 TIGR04282 family arsenosugar biosynthesis glycosyltransferase [Pseudomonadota bacterium]